MSRLHPALALIALPFLASCVAPRASAPAPVSTPAPAVAAPVPGPAAPAPRPTANDRYQGDWSVADLGPGEWRYRREGAASAAHFGLANEGAEATIRCEGGMVTLSRMGVIPADMAAFINVRTSFAERQLPIRSASRGWLTAAPLAARDPLWDQIIYSRGRFLIEATRNEPMLVPTRSDVARVIEDCR
ncbi:MAG: hypothetical protein K2X31_03625 [Sphingopyxis sp.]|nr:hypothetical protein [Sphingopyxis sp.]